MVVRGEATLPSLFFSICPRAGGWGPFAKVPPPFHHGVGVVNEQRGSGQRSDAGQEDRTTTWMATWMPRGCHVARAACGSLVAVLLVLATWHQGRARTRLRLSMGSECVAEAWPWLDSSPTRALCVRNTSAEPWDVRQTSLHTRSTSLREQSCAPPPKCDDTWHVEAEVLAAEDAVFDLETPRDQGSMHFTVVKVVGEDGTKYVVKDTSYDRDHGDHAVRCAYAIGTIVENCGFQDVVARPMVRNVLAVLKDVNKSREMEIRFRNGHVSTYQPGVSLVSVSHVGHANKEKRSQTLELLRNISPQSVLLAATFDYLTLQYDRVAKNVLVDEQNHVHLIDNLDSSFGKYLGHQASEQKQIHASIFLEPASTLYVGCYFNLQHRPPEYPSKLQTCLAEIQGNTTQQLYETYRLPDLETAQKFHQRAVLLRGGLDVALAYYLGVRHLQGLQCVRR